MAYTDEGGMTAEDEGVRELHFPNPRLGPPARWAVTTAEKSPDVTRLFG